MSTSCVSRFLAVLLLSPLSLSPLHAQTAYFSGAVSSLGGGFGLPRGVAVDGRGNVYVADEVDQAVKEIPPGCASSSCVTTLGGGFRAPYGIAVDASGNVYTADSDTDRAYEIPAGCGSSSCVITLEDTFGHPEGIAVDSQGNVYVADYEDLVVDEIPFRLQLIQLRRQAGRRIPRGSWRRG